MGHFENGEPHPSVPTRLRPAGQLTTTAGDMARLARFLMSDGRIDGLRFIDKGLLDSMGVPVGTEAVQAGLEVGYALGLSTRDRHGALGKCHGGSTVGFHAMFCLFPQHKSAFFLSINTDSETAQYDRFHALLIHALKVDELRRVRWQARSMTGRSGTAITCRRRIAWRLSRGSTLPLISCVYGPTVTSCDFGRRRRRNSR